MRPQLAGQAPLRGERGIEDDALHAAGMPAEDLDRLLDPAAMTEPGLDGGPAGG